VKKSEHIFSPVNSEEKLIDYSNILTGGLESMRNIP